MRLLLTEKSKNKNEKYKKNALLSVLIQEHEKKVLLGNQNSSVYLLFWLWQKKFWDFFLEKIWLLWFLLLLFIFNIKLCLWCVDRPLKRILINTHKFSFLCHKTNRKIFNKFPNVNISVLKYMLVYFLLAGKWKNESTATRRFKDFHNFKVSSRIYFTTIIICGSYFPSFFCFLSLFWL